MHASFNPEDYILKYSELEHVQDVTAIRHRIIREVFSQYGIKGVDFASAADIPGGTGLGSSSAFTVGLLNLCNAYTGGRFLWRNELAERACDVELHKLHEPIGKQDQYGCALGGMNFIRFHEDDTVTYEEMGLDREQGQKLKDNLVMLYLGGTRSASEVLKAQNTATRNDPQVVENLKAMAQQAVDLRRVIEADVDVLGEFLHEGWERKRRLTAGISNPLIDAAYKQAIAAGATGGKLLGAGGSGFLLFYCPNGTRQAVVDAMPGLLSFPVEMDHMGTTIIYRDGTK